MTQYPMTQFPITIGIQKLIGDWELVIGNLFRITHQIIRLYHLHPVNRFRHISASHAT